MLWLPVVWNISFGAMGQLNKSLGCLETILDPSVWDSIHANTVIDLWPRHHTNRWSASLPRLKRDRWRRPSNLNPMQSPRLERASPLLPLSRKQSNCQSKLKRWSRRLARVSWYHCMASRFCPGKRKEKNFLCSATCAIIHSVEETEPRLPSTPTDWSIDEDGPNLEMTLVQSSRRSRDLLFKLQVQRVWGSLPARVWGWAPPSAKRLA